MSFVRTINIQHLERYSKIKNYPVILLSESPVSCKTCHFSPFKMLTYDRLIPNLKKAKNGK